MTRKIYKNANGNLSVEQFLKLIKDNELDQWMRNHTTLHSPCPPRELIDDDSKCFYCVECQQMCLDKIKDKKDHYLVKNKKYMKSEL